jgi:hypothetical protein
MAGFALSTEAGSKPDVVVVMSKVAAQPFQRVVQGS